MQLTGRDVYGQIFGRDHPPGREAERDLNFKINNMEREIASDVSLRDQTLTKLAEKYLQARDEQNVAALIRDASQTVNRLFQDKARRRDQINGLIDQLEADARAAGEAAAATTAKIEAIDHKWADVCAAVEKQLGETPEVAAARQTADQLQRRMEKNTAALLHATETKSRFTKDYDKDPVFAYLHAREGKTLLQPGDRRARRLAGPRQQQLRAQLQGLSPSSKPARAPPESRRSNQDRDGRPPAGGIDKRRAALVKASVFPPTSGSQAYLPLQGKGFPLGEGQKASARRKPGLASPPERQQPRHPEKPL